MIFRAIAVFVVLAVAAAPAVFGQSAGAQANEPLSVEMMIIRENSMSPLREQNLFALSQIESAVGRGGFEDELYSALERLVFAGTMHRIVGRGGHILNYFPDVRQEAARQLGVVGTEEARAILLRAGLVELQPMVLQELLNSLGNIPAEDNAQTIAAIVWIGNRFHNSLLPNNHVALAAVNALESIAGRDGGLTCANAFWYLFSVLEGPYVLAVRERAREVIDGLRVNG